MYGAIVGDIVGSRFEAYGPRERDFEFYPRSGPRATFTDDTVLTVAVAAHLMTGEPYVDLFHRFAHAYPDRGYGPTFMRWAMRRDPLPYNSWGNGSAMRVSPVGWFFDTLEETLDEAKRSAEVTHNHPEGVKGAQAVACAMYLARTGVDPEDIRQEISRRFGYNMDRSCEEIRRNYSFDMSCQGSVPEAIVCFVESSDFESAVRNAVALCGDTDTQADMAGAIAQAYYGAIPEEHMAYARAALTDDLREIADEFHEKRVESKL